MHDIELISDSNAQPLIKAIHVLSTGSGEQHKEHRYGTKLPQMWWVLMSRSWIEIPINVFLIEHRDGLILFDTGLDPEIKTNPNYISSAIGRFLLRRIFRLHINAKDKLGQKLKALGFPPRAIQKAVISHLHFDHVGGIADIPQADLIISEAEWEQLSMPHPEHEWILREHIELPSSKWNPITYSSSDDPLFSEFEGVYDLMGDGSMILLPTPGHTRGSMSMLIRSEMSPPILFIGDLAYGAEFIFEDRIPGTGDAKELLRSYSKVRHLKDKLPDLLIIASHDTNAAELLKKSAAN